MGRIYLSSLFNDLAAIMSSTAMPTNQVKYNLRINHEFATKLIITSPTIHITSTSLCSPILPFNNRLHPIPLPTRLPLPQLAPTTTSHPYGANAHSPCARLFSIIHRTSPFPQNAASVLMTHLLCGHSRPRDLRSRSQDTFRRTFVSISLLRGGAHSVLRFLCGFMEEG